MASAQRRYSKEEFARRGDTVYERDVRPHLGPQDNGKFVAVDIETGGYEIDADELAACNRLRVRIPDAQIWMVRVGARFVYRFGRYDVREGSRLPAWSGSASRAFG
jgi:hypothetical protein